jgi:proteasome accessory factor B
MPTTEALTKMDRLTVLLRYAQQHPDGFRTRAAAAELGLHERTVRRYIVELAEKGWLPVYPEKGQWRLVEGGRISPLPMHLNLDEALAVYLAVRLLSGYSDKHNPHAVTAMKKLAGAMPVEIGGHIRRTAAGTEWRRRDEAYLKNLETLTQAWAERRRIRFRYTAPGRGSAAERQVDPYFIEPSAVGYACYLIGYDHGRQAIRIFKVERMGRVDLLDIRFEIQPGFDPYRYLENAWGVMGGDDVVEVVLRFSPDVRYRVRESDWPGVVSLEDQPDGGCILTLRVSHTLEMVPWIRGWGPDCEVLAPEDLRQRIAEDMRKAAGVYGGGEMQGRGNEQLEGNSG